MKNQAILTKQNAIPSSFRDPSSQLFTEGDKVYRKISSYGIDDYNELMSSGLYDKLIELEYLIPHEQIDDSQNSESIIIQPEKVNFISYPYEWSYSQYKDAALLTLAITKVALNYGMVLKDASAYNIQFHRGKPVLIDTCSFERYQEGTPWVAYNQFCKHFLAPIALMAKTNIQLGSLMKLHIDGVPLDLASKLLPVKSRLSLFLLMHIHIHSTVQSKYSDAKENLVDDKKLPKQRLLSLLQYLEDGVKSLAYKKVKTEWGNYYNETNYSSNAADSKLTIIKSIVEKIQPSTLWDLGANNGLYSRACSDLGTSVVSFDIDPIAVDFNYQYCKENNIELVLPLIQDLVNPSSDIGWAHTERDSLLNRGKPDMIMALALVHHLAISNNVPFDRIADFFSSLSNKLLIEFVPREDSQVNRLLANRKDIFFNYHIDGFIAEVSNHYNIIEKIEIDDTCRTLFLMEAKSK